MTDDTRKVGEDMMTEMHKLGTIGRIRARIGFVILGVGGWVTPDEVLNPVESGITHERSEYSVGDEDE